LLFAARCPWLAFLSFRCGFVMISRVSVGVIGLLMAVRFQGPKAVESKGA
jgi:hypothetical protein